MFDIKKALYAGILIGIGNIPYMFENCLGAIPFFLAFLVAIRLNLDLYISQIGSYKKYDFKFLTKTLLGNLIGAVFVCMLFLIIQPEITKFDIPLIPKYSVFSLEPISLFIRSLLCGVCMHIMSLKKNVIITFFCIIAFAIFGFRHCIAEFPFLVLNFSLSNLLKFISVFAGNSIGAMLMGFLAAES